MIKAALVDLEVGNMRSLTAALEFLGVQYVVTADSNQLAASTHIILPGVGAFDAAVSQLRTLGLEDVLRSFVQKENRPILGVCLGMQMLFAGSEEGSLPGLGFVDGKATKLEASHTKSTKVPHVGFSTVHGYSDEGLFRGLGPTADFYFTHSYAIPGMHGVANIAECQHTSPFVAGFQVGLLCGVQFHPEKSQATGLALLRNFLRLTA